LQQAAFSNELVDALPVAPVCDGQRRAKGTYVDFRDGALYGLVRRFRLAPIANIFWRRILALRRAARGSGLEARD